MEKSNRSRLEHDIVELELERVKYMLKAYLRIRKLKVPLFSDPDREEHILHNQGGPVHTVERVGVQLRDKVALCSLTSIYKSIMGVFKDVFFNHSRAHYASKQFNANMKKAEVAMEMNIAEPRLMMGSSMRGLLRNILGPLLTMKSRLRFMKSCYHSC